MTIHSGYTGLPAVPHTEEQAPTPGVHTLFLPSALLGPQKALLSWPLLTCHSYQRGPA
jgi:hypothetical protein